MKPQIPSLFAHRGCSGAAPENTLSAFKLAADQSIPGVELDVQFAQSGEVVVIHDTNLKRLAGVDIAVDNVHWSELQTVDVGSWFDKSFAAERIPLLEQLFETLGNRVFYDIELKTQKRRFDRLPLEVAGIVARFGLEKHCMISSFNPFAVRTTRIVTKSRPLITSVIYSKSTGIPALLRRGAGCTIARCDVAKPHWQLSGKLAVARHHFLGRRVSSWTVNDVPTARNLYAAGVDAVISDVPEQLLHLAKNRDSNAGI